MYEHKDSYSITRMAKVLEVSESGYYKWLNKLNAKPTDRELQNKELSESIFQIYRRSRGSYGSRKITAVIRKTLKKPVNHKRVERIMREHGWFSKVSKKYVCTTDSAHDNVIADNLIGRVFTASRPNEKMVSDTTVIATDQGSLYVAGIIDLYGRMPVGLSMSRNNDRYLVMDALKDMLARGLGSEGCIVHSDRGSTYTSSDYRKLLSANNLLCSMSGKGDCWDNAPMECFWSKLKEEWLKDKYKTIDEAKRDVYEYVWHFYPKERPHEANGYLTPYEYYSNT